jgi:hypothetical protein
MDDTGPYQVAPKEELQEGAFYLDREVVPVHVSTGWLTGTQYKDADVDTLATALTERFEGVLASA